MIRLYRSLRRWWPFLLGAGVGACVQEYSPDFRATLDIVVVDGTLSNLPEAQFVTLSRSRADSVNGRFGARPIAGAHVEVVVDSQRVLALTETTPGRYELPAGFRGEVGHRYQLRFQLGDGRRYASAPETMTPVPPIARVYEHYNPYSLKPDQPNATTGANEFFIDIRDPVGVRNYYRWDWTSYEKQTWCRSCAQGVYVVNCIKPFTYVFGSYFVSDTGRCEDCFTPRYDPDPYAPRVSGGDWYYDYPCRTECWEILRNYTLNLFEDRLTDGGLILGRNVAQVPFYQRGPALVEIRQSSISREAYRYFKLFEDQTENTGGLADTPPAPLVGNVRNLDDERENVAGYFVVSAVSSIRYWLDRSTNPGFPVGYDPSQPNRSFADEFFFALSGRYPYPEPAPPYTGEREEARIKIWGGPPRPPTAVCVPSETRTPFKPAGWRD